MPAPYQGGLFMSLRGSWNRQPISGAKIIYLEFDDDADTIANAVHEFCTGFIQDSNDVDTRWARPVGLAMDREGAVYITSDAEKQFIMKLSPPTTNQRVRNQFKHSANACQPKPSVG